MVNKWVPGGQINQVSLYNTFSRKTCLVNLVNINYFTVCVEATGGGINHKN